MIVIKKDKLPPNPYGALTLSTEYLGRHDDGWEIVGAVHEDYCEWVNSFVAYKHDGYDSEWVAGDFEKGVVASSKEAYNEFIEKYPPSSWDYEDI